MVNSIDGLIIFFCHGRECFTDGQMCRLNVRHSVVVYILTSAFHIQYAPILRKQDKRFYDVEAFHTKWLRISFSTDGRDGSGKPHGVSMPHQALVPFFP